MEHLKAYNYIKRETPKQVFSCELCEVLKTPSEDRFCKKSFLLVIIRREKVWNIVFVSGDYVKESDPELVSQGSI